ncbi:RNA-directed DNA polymerase, eukaryota, Reverse transcriptase zinc-binding domain protein [Artemisia annua]|uniref:RNA-directed DNA polymerase, eukaryota, Reverse transcriptase zinc-binding domain protein n=1 Tax=Artemisia annua TaxID=35608 RepID=A0A2U1P4J0_ARTAN|nr:RNA-directed DNA polymerase, eukaryota, Reverse transcriptase zinc-binding domain protein [Artemisia annua]
MIVLYSYCYMTDKWGSKISKLGRFFVSESLYETFPNITGLILEKGVPDHRPIFIQEHMTDFEPTPFRFFHSWLELEGFHSMVVETWINDGIVEANGLILFKKKLQNLKCAIRVWIAAYRSDSQNLKREHLLRLSSIDIKIDQGTANESDFSNHRDPIHILEELDKREAIDIAQKAMIKWAMEGDENSHFFHATLKKKHRQLSIKGIQKNGDWIVEPDRIKDKFMAHFQNRFQAPVGFPSTYVADMVNCLSPDQATNLELIKSFYGHHGGIFDVPTQRSSLSPWCGILSSINSLKLKGIDLLAFCTRKLGNGVNIRFWDDVWCGTLPLKLVFPRIYMLDTDRNCNVANRASIHDRNQVLRRIPRGGIEASQLADLKNRTGDVVLSEHKDAWKWSPDINKGFSVASSRILIDSHILEGSPIATRWNGCIPIKVNIFLWRFPSNNEGF